MKKEINTTWQEGMIFETNLGNHKITIDATVETGGQNKGPGPKSLLMVSLAGCTGMDVISILKKMKIEPEYFNVKTEGDLNDEHPKKYNQIVVTYEFRGKNLPMNNLEKAVNLSVEKYCGVIATLREAVKLEFHIKILD